MVTEWQGRVQQRGFLIPPPLAGEGLRSRRASSPVFFTAPGRPSLIVRRAAPKKSRGRAGRQGSKRTRGPRHLAASRRAEVRITRLRSCELRRASRKSAQPKASRARCLEVCSASPPGGLPVSGDPPLLSNWKAAYPPLWAQVGSGEPVTGAVPAITGPGDARLARRDEAAWTAGWVIDAASPASPTGHRSPPRVRRRLIRCPSVTRVGFRYLIL